MMSYLETGYFVWDFLSWSVSFLLAALIIFIIFVVVRKHVEAFSVDVGDCPETERELFAHATERFLWRFRVEIIDIWLNRPWSSVIAPFFFLLLFLTAVYV